MKLNSVKFFVPTLLASISLLSLVSLSSHAKQSKERWFEVEVILFTQLGDKERLKEQFDIEHELPVAKKTYDLLSSYVQPDISYLKPLLHACSALTANADIATNTPSPFAPATLPKLINTTVLDINLDNGIDQLFSIEVEEFSQTPTEEGAAKTKQEQAEVLGENVNLDDSTFEGIEPLAEEILDATNNAEAIEILDTADAVEIAETIDMVETVDDVDTVEAAETIEVYQPKAITDYTSHFPYHTMCIIKDGELMEGNNNDYQAEKLATTVNADENLFSKKPYLLSKSSLQLTDIVNELYRSRNLKPLLHVAWREAPKGRKTAVAQRIFAGDNLTAHYQKTLATAQSAQAKHILSELKEKQTEKLIQGYSPHSSQEAPQQVSTDEQYQVTPLAPAFVDEKNTITTLSPQRQLAAAQHQDMIEAVPTDTDVSTIDLPNDVISTNTSDEAANEVTNDQYQQLAQDQVQQRINDIIAQVKAIVPSNEQNIIGELDNEHLKLSFERPDNSVLLTLADEMIEQPKAPLQPWYLDGFFKVNLNHYLYITADFNLMNMTLDQQKKEMANTLVPVELKRINFKQSRRVISGEIHYFDHPYMGMIVQIRRFTPPKK